MKKYSLSHVANDALLQNTVALAEGGRANTADLVAHIAEIDARKLYAPAAYESLLAYCMGELRLSRAEALKRIRVARVARRFPVIFEALADGRMHLTTVIQLKRFLNERSVERLIAAAAHKDTAEVEQLLAELFPSLDVPAQVIELPPAPRPEPSRTPATVGRVSPETLMASAPTVAPLSSETFAVQFTMSRVSHDKLRRAQELLSHVLPSGDLAAVMERALDALLDKLEKQKFSATEKPRRSRPSRRARHIPAEIKRVVWQRDGGQCTFVSDTGRRCASRTRLEFDHVLEVARGGESTVDNVRMRCRAHNQFTAEQTFGTEFMERKREAAVCGPRGTTYYPAASGAA